MINSLNFNHLYYFYIIAKKGSLSKAAQCLQVSQPTLSQQLKLLEEHFGQELFNRKGRSLAMNRHGEYIYGYASKIFDHAERMILGWSYNSQIETNSNYKIGITSSVSRSYAAKLLKPLFSDPAIGVSVSEGNLADLIDDFNAFELDFILTETPDENLLTESIETYDIRKLKHYFVCGRKFTHKISDIPKDFSGVPYFKYSMKNELQKQIDRFFLAHDTFPSVVGESDDINIILSATEINHCFAVVPDIAVKEIIEEKRLTVLGEFENHETHICALHRKNMSNKSIVNILDVIKDQVAN